MKKYQLHPRMLQSEPMTRCKLHACQAACCIHGVWIDSREAAVILEQASKIQREMSEIWQNPDDWFDGREDQDANVPTGKVLHSNVVNAPAHYGGSACVFLRSDHKCALQTAAVKAGLHAWHLKPFYCILHPLDLDEKGRITLDDTGLLLDEPGSCLRPSKEQVSLLETFEPELRYFMGDAEYESARLLVP